MPVVDDERALIGTQTWYGEPPAARPVFLTYSFPAGPRPEIPGGGEDFMSFFDEAQKSIARDAIAAWGAVCGVTFVETTAHVGDVTFVRYDWARQTVVVRRWSESGGPVPAGIFDADGIPRVRPSWISDLPIQEAITGMLGTTGVILTSSSITPAQQYYALLHEVGHILGLNRPWERDISQQLSAIDAKVTGLVDAPPYTLSLSPLVGRAVQLLYGPAIPPSAPAPWSWDAATETLTQTFTADRALVRGTNARDIITVTGKDAAVATMRGDDIVHAAGQSVEINTGSGFDIVHTGLRYGAFNAPRGWGLNAVLIDDGTVRQFIVGAEQVVFENGIYDTATGRFVGESGIPTPVFHGWHNFAGDSSFRGVAAIGLPAKMRMAGHSLGDGIGMVLNGTDLVGENRVAAPITLTFEQTLTAAVKAVSLIGIESEAVTIAIAYGGTGAADTIDASGDIRAVIDSYGGDDTFTGSPGDDLIFGNTGIDTVRYPGAQAEYRIGFKSVFAIIEGPQGTDILRDVERIAFADQAPVALATLAAEDLLYVTRTTAFPSELGTGFGYSLVDYVLATPYAGPVAWLERQFLGTEDRDAVLGTGRAEFLSLGAQDDAASAGGGDDVLDGGTGSSFLTGGAGHDVFFADARHGRSSWSTITDWESGEQLALWGWLPGISSALWLASDGAPGWTGATMHVDLDGNGTTDASVTWTGQTQAALPTPVELDGLLWFK